MAKLRDGLAPEVCTDEAGDITRDVIIRELAKQSGDRSIAWCSTARFYHQHAFRELADEGIVLFGSGSPNLKRCTLNRNVFGAVACGHRAPPAGIRRRLINRSAHSST